MIFVAISHIADDDMRRPKKTNDCRIVKKGFKKRNKININEHVVKMPSVPVKDKRRTAIYCLMLTKEIILLIQNILCLVISLTFQEYVNLYKV